MNDNTSLDNLHDIYIPPEVGFFPLTEGYVALLVFIGSLFITFVYLLIARYRANRYKREAVKELHTLEDVSAIFLLVKRVLLTSRDRTEVASLSGSALIESMGMFKQKEQLLKASNTIYDPSLTLDGYELVGLKKIVKRWIKKQQGVR